MQSDVIIEVVEAEAPRRLVERNISAAGRRLAHGTYTIEPLPTGGRVTAKRRQGFDEEPLRQLAQCHLLYHCGRLVRPSRHER
ncbi:hypothetical protein [Streptomyces noursei]|uniref:hypothetical protein n=1 Tax=Streptomyces noursei TaxID=1971 RepID=UPI0030B808ED